MSRLGFDLVSENGTYWRATPIYRDSGNKTSLRIRKDNGGFVDFAAGIKGSIYDLIKITLNLKDVKEAKTWVNEHDIEIVFVETKPKLFVKKTFKESEATSLLPHYSFYTKEPRNINVEVLKGLECGVQMSGKQNNRFVFIIRDEDGDIIGLAGRDLFYGDYARDHKWKNLGSKTQWIYPLCAIPHIERLRSLILVESIGDMLALRNAGIYNVLVIFGLDLSTKLLNFIASLDLDEITICTNNDTTKEQNWGQLAAEKIKTKLTRLIDENKIKTKVPVAGDFGEMTQSDIKTFFS